MYSNSYHESAESRRLHVFNQWKTQCTSIHSIESFNALNRALSIYKSLAIEYICTGILSRRNCI